MAELDVRERCACRLRDRPVTSFVAGPVISASIRPFEGLFTEAFFATLLLFVPGVTLLAMVAQFTFVFSCEVRETGG